ncbi:MAG: CDP-alcohol phosphatidyltransferase family protein [Candidatus Neomarinimicrobiota bacterium]
MNKRILNFPNILTFFRIILSVLLYFFYLRSCGNAACFSPLFIFVFYVAIALTDLFDGFLARKLHQETELGEELDPVADKVLVFLMLFAFFRIGILPLWVILPVFLRDIFVNYLRKRSRILNIRFQTSKPAKAKTAVQMIFIGLVLFVPVLLSAKIPPRLYDILYDYISGPGVRVTMIAIMLFTVYTGIDYYLKFQRSLHEHE